MNVYFNPSNIRNLYDVNFLKSYNFLSSIYNKILPNDIKEVFKWVDFIVFNVPLVQSALDKMSSIALTSIVYNSSDLTESNILDTESWKSILEKDLNIKRLIKSISYNFLIYGNQFISVSYPFLRHVRCRNCGEIFTEKYASSFKEIECIIDEQTNKVAFKGECPSCKHESIFEIEDKILKDTSKIKVIQWPIHNIDIKEDHISGYKIFYYTPTENDVMDVKSKDPEILFKKNLNIIKAVITNKKIKFYDNTIYHMNSMNLSGTETPWGIPRLASAIPDMISLLLLRKANEKIYSDMIFPLRAVVPETNLNGDEVYNYVTPSDLRKKIESVLAKWKKDPTSVQVFPVPVKPMDMFGEGKSLNLLNEVNGYSENILNSLGVPLEFIRGGVSYTGSSASLRVLQNQLEELTSQVEGVVNFIIKKIGVFLNKEIIPVKLIPFRLIDNTADRQYLVSLFQMGKVSSHTVLNSLDIDYASERQRMLEERKNEIKDQMELQNYQQMVATSLEDKIKQESMMENSNAWNINQQAILSQADSIAQQLSQLDSGLRKSKLDELAKENPVLYAVVKWRLEFMERKELTELKHQQQQ